MHVKLGQIKMELVLQGKYEFFSTFRVFFDNCYTTDMLEKGCLLLFLYFFTYIIEISVKNVRIREERRMVTAQKGTEFAACVSYNIKISIMILIDFINIYI